MGFDLLINRLIDFVRHNGITVYKEFNHFLMYQSLRYAQRALTIEIKVAAVPGTDGWCWVRVHKDNVCVLEAEGNYYVWQAFNMEAREYAPGLWENELK